MPTDIWRNKNKDKLRKYRRDWYRRNKEHAKRKTIARKQSMRAWLKEYKTNLECVKCGETHIACLEFHHQNPETKELSIASTITQGWGKKRILSEMEKCDVYCANCHRKLHHEM